MTLLRGRIYLMGGPREGITQRRESRQLAHEALSPLRPRAPFAVARVVHWEVHV